MTGEIVNLRRARKQRARTEAELAAAANRAAFGRTRGEKARSALERRRAADRLDEHRLQDKPDRTGEDA